MQLVISSLFLAIYLHINGSLPCTPHIIATDEDPGLG